MKIFSMNFVWLWVHLALLVAVAPLVAGITKKTKARLQNRTGASVVQDYFDLYKWWQKPTLVTPQTGLIFISAPLIYLVSVLSAAALLPQVAGGEVPGDIFVLVALLAMGRFFLTLASLDAATAFGGMGGSRELYLAVLVEPALLLAVLSVAVERGGTGLSVLVGQTGGMTVAGTLTAVAFFALLLAETGRIPVDNPDTHLELTMIHEGMLLEYSGRLLAVIHVASMVKSLLLLCLFASVFLPWGLPVAVKVVGTAVALGVAETLNNKMRLFRVRSYMVTTGILLVLAIVAQ
ncbi:MAG: NADH-quinone oxidoreductase subunit H [Acidaminococcaceae bacterium]